MSSVSLDSHDLNFSNRLVRTRMPGGVAGAQLTAAPYAVQSRHCWFESNPLNQFDFIRNRSTEPASQVRRCHVAIARRISAAMGIPFAGIRRIRTKEITHEIVDRIHACRRGF
jgi:hypothetical protein